MLVSGKSAAVEHATVLVDDLIGEDGAKAKARRELTDERRECLPCKSSMAGFLIGKGGSGLGEVETMTGAKVCFPTWKRKRCLKTWQKVFMRGPTWTSDDVGSR